jgi:hypothetical protein
VQCAVARIKNSNLNSVSAACFCKTVHFFILFWEQNNKNYSNINNINNKHEITNGNQVVCFPLYTLSLSLLFSLCASSQLLSRSCYEVVCLFFCVGIFKVSLALPCKSV